MEPITSSGWCPFAKQHLLADHYGLGSLQQRNTIVCHITEGSTAASAIATFEASTSPNRVSAHFVIDRDGTITQLVNINNTAWHASQVNSHAVGIEHVALSADGAAALNKRYPEGAPYTELLATDAQYESSAKLLFWLCSTLGIPADRAHIRTHNEASPADGHVQCCTGALDIDKLVSMVPAGE